MKNNLMVDYVSTADVIKFLKKRIGQTFEVQNVYRLLNINTKNSSIYSVLNRLNKNGMISFIKNSKPKEFIINDSMVDHKPKNNKRRKPVANKKQSIGFEHVENNPIGFSSNGLLNENQQRTDIQNQFRHEVENAASIDIAQTMSRVVMVSEQNKILREALEKIVLILDQAGVIERSS